MRGYSYPVPACAATPFKRSRVHHTHMSSEEEFTCSVCNEAFDSREELEEHGKEAHQDHDPEESDDHA